MSTKEEIDRLQRLQADSIGIGKALSRLPPEQLYEQACRIAVEQGGFLMAWVGCDDPVRAQLVPVARWGQDAGYLDAIHISTDPLYREGLGPGGTAYRSGAPAVCNDIEADREFFAFRKEALAHGFRSCAAFPLKLQGQPVAVFFVYAGEADSFDAQELSLLTSLSDNVEAAMKSRERADAQQQRASLEQLQRKEALLSMASRLGRIGAWEVELPSLAVTWSEELAVIHGMPPGYSPSFQEAMAFYTPEVQTTIATAFGACITDGTPFDLELQIVNASGRLLSVRSIGEAVRDADAVICRAQGALQDITDRRLAEAEIAQLAERLTTTLESITDALVTVDADWRFTYLNREAERVLKRSRGELLGKHMWEEFPEARGTAIEAAYTQALVTGRAMELEHYYPPLETWLGLRAYPARQGGLTIYFRDVGERHAAQQEILRLNANLEQRVRQRTAQLEIANQELKAFSYSVAHDLRAPLAAISGFGHALERELSTGAGKKAHHYLSRMREGATRTSEMIDALLSLAQQSRTELRWEHVDLSAMAHAAAQACREHTPERAVDIRIQDGLTARGDPRLLRLVLDNLLTNAWKFTEQAARTRIVFDAIEGADGEVVFRVTDNGVGFDMAYVHKLFGAFQRLHAESEFPGTGIGLANVRRILARHSGRVWAHSRPGEGASFYFTLGAEPA